MANLTRTRQAVIIEPLRPEKFYVKTFNATSLYILSICEVRERDIATNPEICKSKCKPELEMNNNHLILFFNM